MKKYRNQGAIGALLDEYERAIGDLLEVMRDVTPAELATIVDAETNDPDCKSIQNILAHVIRSGYGYAIYVRRHMGEDIDFVERVYLHSTEEFQAALMDMFRFNERLFNDYPDLEIETIEQQKKMVVSWGQTYDVEQIFEHAIVHVLRHRRQIERFLVSLRSRGAPR